MKTYYVYSITNKNKTVLYIGFTNDLIIRLFQHKEACINHTETFTANYQCHHLLYFEIFENPLEGIEREKQLKKWSRKKKEWLIEKENPTWKFLEQEWEEFY